MTTQENMGKTITSEDAKSIAQEAFLWGMHPVAINHLRYNYAQNEKSPYLVGINRMRWERKPMKALPPVTEFWEMPLYEREGYFYDNPIDRYSLNSYMLKRGKLHTEGGKLVICIQHGEPTDPNQRRNWLPAPKEPFGLILRLYAPHSDVIQGGWVPPAIKKIS
jgi:hypothetical protein